MPRKTDWKKAEAKTVIEAIAAELAKAFNIPAPAVHYTEYPEWRFETVEVWTKAGRAECNVTIGKRFAHMYFRFDDPARASRDLFHGYHDGDRLNRHSGKWNSLESAPNSLAYWAEELAFDFRKVAEPNPTAEEVAAYRVKEAEANARWAAAFADLESANAAAQGPDQRS